MSSGVLHGIPGYAPSRILQGLAQQVKGADAAARVRLLDEQGAVQVHSLGEVPQVFWGLAPADLASLDEFAQLTKLGDVVVSEKQASTL